MQTKPLNFVVVGLGMGLHHAKAIQKDRFARVKYLCDLDSKKISQAEKVIGIRNHVSTTYEKALQDPDVHAVSIASFDDHHFRQVVQALESGKHVFVEKPLCQKRGELFKIQKMLSKKQLGLASNLVLRTAPLYINLRRWILQGKLGNIYAFDGDYLFGRVEKITQGWRKDVPNYSVMEGGGIHMIDLMLWITGQKPNSVTSYANKIVTVGTDFRYHDFHAANFIFPSGMIGRITANFGCMHPHQHAIRIFGSKGTFIHDDRGSRMYWKRKERSKGSRVVLESKPNEKGLLLHQFIKNIRLRDLTSMAQQEIDLMSVVLSADQALQSGRPVRINYIKWPS